MSDRRQWAEEMLGDESRRDRDAPDEWTGPLFMDGLDDAIVGVGSQYTKPTLVVYDYARILEVLSRGGMPEEDVVEYVDFNILGAWAGEYTPFIMRSPEE